MRRATIQRKTKETDIAVSICLTAPESLDRHRRRVLRSHARSRSPVTEAVIRRFRPRATCISMITTHVEDVGIVLGQAFPPPWATARDPSFADAYVPMDEALTRAAIDLSGRPFLVFEIGRSFRRRKSGRSIPSSCGNFSRRFRRGIAARRSHRQSAQGQQPPHRRICFQGLGSRLCVRRVNRPASGWRHSVHQRRALSKELSVELSTRFQSVRIRRRSRC